MKTFTFSFLMLVLLMGLLNAQIINVPADKTTIQAAIDSASAGDTVLVAEGLYYENINFNGKAITVASRFIEWGDTSHISKTIIDGSKFTNWKKASTVLMESGEDTTSILMGFTITGGQGVVNTQDPDWKEYYGSGVVIMNSGGKIVHNTIEGNHLVPAGEYEFTEGGGMSANVNGNRTAIFRHNIIRNNTVKGKWSYGGGLVLCGGRIIFEFNTITDNICEGKNAYGGGLFWSSAGYSGTIQELFIRNNIIAANKSQSTGGEGLIYGGGITTGLKFKTGIIEIYNNLIYDNSTEGYGGGLYSWLSPTSLYNNTIYNNEAGMGGNGIGIHSGDMVMFNNITGLDSNSAGTDFYFNPEYISTISLEVHNNILRFPFKPEDPVTASGNLYLEPYFKTDSYELSDTSPAIGRGIESVSYRNTWYYAPNNDFYGNKRPHPIDIRGDMGAIESEYKPVLLPIADLSYMGIYDYEIIPDFHKDTLDYELPVHDTILTSAALQAMPHDIRAYVDINHASDLTSPDPTKRTATISVTSSDSSTQKVYTVLFRYLSTDATLKNLSVGCGVLQPEFNSDITIYNDTLPPFTTEAPEILYELNDTLSTAVLRGPEDITSPNVSKRIAWIDVTAEDKTIKHYGIIFTVDTACSHCDSCIIIGIEDQYEINKINIYPNPTNTNFTIDMKTIPPAQKIEILSIDGRIVRILDHVPGNSITIGRENLPSGIYFVKIHSDKTYVGRVIIK